MSPGRPWNWSWRQMEQWSFQLPARPSSPVGQLSLAMRQLLPLRPSCSSKISLPTTTRTETFHRSATSFRTRPPPCLSVASQPGRGRSGLTPSLPQAHLETGQYKNSRCLEAAQYNSPVSMDLLRLKRSGEKKIHDAAPHRIDFFRRTHCNTSWKT